MQDIYIDDQGNGFPLVLIHGFLGSSEMWSPQKEFLSKHFRVISPALPGFGESYKVKSQDNINIMVCTSNNKCEYAMCANCMSELRIITKTMLVIANDTLELEVAPCYGDDLSMRV